MRFCFVDKVTALERGRSITVTKGVSYAEPFLADHFPGAPVLPGAMMLEAAVEAAMWLLRQDRDFPLEDYQVVHVRQGKFSRVVRPGDVLSVEVTVDGEGDDGALAFRAKGTCGADKVFSARFSIRPRPLDPAQGERHAATRQAQRQLWSVLYTTFDDD